VSLLQGTIRQAHEFPPGVGLHTGETISLRCLPAPENHGIVFRRTDLPGRPEVPAILDSLDESALQRQTSLVCGEARVGTVEHLLACCTGFGIDNLVVEIDGPELPMYDGSARVIAKGLAQAGIERQSAARKPVNLKAPFVYREDLAAITVLPADSLRATYFAQFDHPSIGAQAADWHSDAKHFMAEVAPARTFCMLEDVERLRSAGLIRGGSLDCAVVFGPDGPVDSELRFPNEPARHKLLDLLGDLCLLGRPLNGIIMASRTGHRVHAAFLRELRKEIASND